MPIKYINIGDILKTYKLSRKLPLHLSIIQFCHGINIEFVEGVLVVKDLSVLKTWGRPGPALWALGASVQAQVYIHVVLATAVVEGVVEVVKGLCVCVCVESWILWVIELAIGLVR